MSDTKPQKEKKIRPKSRAYAVSHAILADPIRFFTRIHVHNKENEPLPETGACLVICNHMVWRDPIILCAALKYRQPHFMAKKELFKIPLLGGIIRAFGAYPVNRGGADVSAIKYTISLLQNGVTVGMFPQGHRYNGVDPRTTKPKVGAAMISLKADVPVMPVYIKVKNNKARLFCRKDVYFGKPVTPAEMNYNPENPGEYDRIMGELFEKVCALGDDRS